MQVRLEKVTKLFGNVPAVKEVSFTITDGELFFLLGPSGCGKTTLLRLLAGFYQADGGQIFFGDRCINTLPAEHHNCGMVFQNYALWPHLTVAQNVGYGLDVRKVPAPEAKQRIQEALNIVQMSDYADRNPNQLSGGQQQRVALARAIVIRPDVLLLDEPLSNLDARLRLAMREEIRRIHSQTGITTLYVTHDQSEALSMAHHIAIIRQGVVEQIGTPAELYRTPATPFAADFLGEVNWLEGTIEDSTPQSTHINVAGSHWVAQTPLHPLPLGTRVKIGFRPESVSFTEKREDLPNQFESTVSSHIYMGSQQESILTFSSPAKSIIKATELNPSTIHPVGTSRIFNIPPNQILIFASSPK